MRLNISYNEEKNLLLKQTRKINFEDIESAIDQGNLLDTISHSNKKKYPNQKILVVKVKKYIYAVPYVHNIKTNTVFLKTVYPDRKLTKSYLKKKHDSKKTK